MNYARGTSLEQSQPWGLFTGGRALCSDGKVRKLARISMTADTFFSIPAAVRVAGKTVTGFVTVETITGFTTATENDPAVVKFVAVKTGKNHGLLPEGTNGKFVGTTDCKTV
jgi:uncharacterized membrane protein